jgi:HEAT repeat protein
MQLAWQGIVRLRLPEATGGPMKYMLLWNRIQLRSSDPQTRLKAIEALEKTQNESVIDPLLRCFADSELSVRAAAARVLGERRSEHALMLIIDCLSDGRPEVREASAMALSWQGDTRACSVLKPLLDDPEHSVRSSAAAALRKLGWTAASHEEKAAFEVASGKAICATFSGRAAVNPLVRTLNHQASEVRRSVASALEFVDDPRALRPLMDAANDEDPNVRVSAIHALGKAVWQTPVLALLHKLAWDSNSRVRLAAVQVLGKMNNARLAPLFLGLLKDPHFEIRLAAVQFLGRQGNAELAPQIAPLLADKDNDVRFATAQALGEMPSPAVIEPLVLALADEEKPVRQAAEAALNKIDLNWVQSQDARNASRKLEQLLQGRPAWVRASAGHLVQKLNAPADPASPAAPAEQPALYVVAA